MEFIQEIGALAGIAAFVGLAVLALLYFTQAKDVRRLRENASFLIEGPLEDEIADEPAARSASEPATQAQPASKDKPKGKAAKPPSDAESFRRAELARQAAERRERFERRRGGSPRLSRGGEGRFSSWPEPRALAVIAIGGALLIAGIVFVATGAFSGDEPTSARSGPAPADTQVAVLNSTSEPGLAADSARQLKQLGYNVDPVDNTSVPLDQSAVMYEKQGQAAAREIARRLRLPAPAPLLDEIRPDAAGAVVIVVLGEDKASGA